MSMRYKTVFCKDIKTLDERVNNALIEGWIPLFPPYSIADPSGKFEIACQPMYREIKNAAA